MIEFFQRLFETTFMPHGHCYYWQPGLLWLHVGSDALIAGAYLAIPGLLVWFVRKRRDLAFKWMFVLFGLFILFCGFTHLMRIVTVWYGVYWIEGGVKLLTGAVSVATAALLVPLVPKALQLPTPTELRKANEALQEEIEQRKQAEKELEEAYEKLKETERLKDEFFANVSHELRTPLTLILSPVESILEEDLEESFEKGTLGQAGHPVDATPETDSEDADSEDESLETSGSGGDADDGPDSEGRGAEEAASSTLSPGHRRRLETVHNNAIRMLQMVNGLLDFSKLEIGEVEVSREPVDIETLTRSVCRDFDPLSERKGVELDFDAALQGQIVEMDRYLYERIVFNLLSNAVKFTPSGGEVWVRLSQDEECLRLTVADTGEGIPEEELEHIFADFRQVDASSTRRFEGTGLGLPLVKEFTELLEGRVSVESTPDVGSTFTVELHAPISDRPETVDEEQRSHMLAQQFGRERSEVGGEYPEEEEGRPATEEFAEEMFSSEAPLQGEEASSDEALADVVLAEDNGELSTYIEDLLAGTCRVHVARDGEEALQLVQEIGPALVITDIMMPKKDGLAVCRELKDSPSTADIPVVMLTALTNRKALLRGWEAGADEYLFKPFHPKELVTRIRTLLRNIRRRQEAEEAQKKLEQKLLRASERERRRIGQNLHDGLGAHMTGMTTLVQSLLSQEPNEDGTVTVDAQRLTRVADLAQEGARQARTLARGLNPVKLDQKGLPAALQTLAELQEQQFDLTCTFEQEGALPELSEDASINLYWIAHEAVRNAIKHGGADRVGIQLWSEEQRVILEVTDNGTGLPAPPEELEEGMGLATMRYRAELIGGSFEVIGQEKGGTRVSCVLSTPSASEGLGAEETTV